jgi:hypothetical protein
MKRVKRRQLLAARVCTGTQLLETRYGALRVSRSVLALLLQKDACRISFTQNALCSIVVGFTCRIFRIRHSRS